MPRDPQLSPNHSDNLKYGSIGSPVEYDENEPRCYTDEWKRTSPDHVVYLPQQFIGIDTDNVHFLVTPTKCRRGRSPCWAYRTQATYEAADNSTRVVTMRRPQRGRQGPRPGTRPSR